MDFKLEGRELKCNHLEKLCSSSPSRQCRLIRAADTRSEPFSQSKKSSVVVRRHSWYTSCCTGTICPNRSWTSMSHSHLNRLELVGLPESIRELLFRWHRLDIVLLWPRICCSYMRPLPIYFIFCEQLDDMLSLACVPLVIPQENANTRHQVTRIAAGGGVSGLVACLVAQSPVEIARSEAWRGRSRSNQDARRGTSHQSRSVSTLTHPSAPRCPESDRVCRWAPARAVSCAPPAQRQPELPASGGRVPAGAAA